MKIAVSLHVLTATFPAVHANQFEQKSVEKSPEHQAADFSIFFPLQLYLNSKVQ